MFERDFHETFKFEAPGYEKPGRRLGSVGARAIGGDAGQPSDNSMDLFGNLIFHPEGSPASVLKYVHLQPKTLDVRRFFFNQPREGTTSYKVRPQVRDKARNTLPRQQE